MKVQQLHGGAERTFAVVFDTNDEVMEGLRRFARENEVTAAHFTAIGAFSKAKLGYFDWESKDYRHIPIDRQVEVVSLIGDIALHGSAPEIHAHVVVSDETGAARGGHIMEGSVRPTLEVVVTEAPAHLRREVDEETGLALIRLEPSGTRR